MTEAPGAVPVVLHAMCMGSKESAETLMPHSRKLIVGLVKRGVKVVLYACDGTEVERSIQRLLLMGADKRVAFKIPSPEDANCPITAEVGYFEGQAVVMVRDSKHALKTFRNNMFSGARFITIGNHCIYFSQISAIANMPGSPLQSRDANSKLDRQDDNAATRLFAADSILFLINNHPEWTAISSSCSSVGSLSTHTRIGILVTPSVFIWSYVPATSSQSGTVS